MKNTNDKRLWTARIIMTVLTASAVIAIFYNSSLDAAESTEQSSPLTEWINGLLAYLPFQLSVTENIVRKAAHFTEYGVLGALLNVTVYLYIRKRLRTPVISLPVGAAVAVCDELSQTFSDGRSCELRDMVIDSCGVLAGALLTLLIISIIEKRRSNRRKVET